MHNIYNIQNVLGKGPPQSHCQHWGLSTPEKIKARIAPGDKIKMKSEKEVNLLLRLWVRCWFLQGLILRQK